MPTFQFENPADVGAGVAGSFLQARSAENARQGEIQHRAAQEKQQQANADRSFGLQEKTFDLNSRNVDSEIASRGIQDDIAKDINARAAEMQPKLLAQAQAVIDAAGDQRKLAAVQLTNAKIDQDTKKIARDIALKYGLKNADATYQQLIQTMHQNAAESVQRIAASRHSMSHEDNMDANDSARVGLEGQRVGIERDALHEKSLATDPMAMLNSMQTPGAKMLFKRFMQAPPTPGDAMTQIFALKAKGQISDADASSLGKFFGSNLGARYDQTTTGAAQRAQGQKHYDAHQLALSGSAAWNMLTDGQPKIPGIGPLANENIHATLLAGASMADPHLVALMQSISKSGQEQHGITKDDADAYLTKIGKQ